MKWTLLALAVAGAMAACSSPSKVVVPDGSNRKPVNSEARIADYRVRTGEEQAAFVERSALMRQVASLAKEIASLKTYVLQLSEFAASNASSHVPRSVLPASAVGQPSKARIRKSIDAPVAGRSESFEIRDDAVVFRVTHPFAKVDFKPSPEFKEVLLRSARLCTRIDIRGRTDATVDDPADRTIAQGRALRARSFLVGNGIDPKKLHVSYLASGDRLASNATVAGRALNRRVEIEAFGLDTRALRDSATTMGSL